jgi:hypothetical protein
VKEFTCDASSAAADLARARNLSVSAANRCPLRSEGTEAGCVAATYDVPRQVYASRSAGPWEWHAAPGPNKRGNMCITHTDPLRGYGFQGECKK